MCMMCCWNDKVELERMARLYWLTCQLELKPDMEPSDAKKFEAIINEKLVDWRDRATELLPSVNILRAEGITSKPQMTLRHERLT